MQDTNEIQLSIALSLARRHGNLCVVGDPDQTIYRFGFLKLARRS